MNRITKNVLLGTGVAVAGAAAASHIVTEYLMRVALDRDVPAIGHMDRAREQLCGIPNAAEFFRMLEESGEALKHSNCEVIEIYSYDGEKLVGHWCECQNAERVIIAMHGWRSSWWRDFGMIADFWRARKCSVLYAEQRGQNGSGGRYMGFGLTERFDCPQWVDWVVQRCGAKLPIYLTGVSMGATTVLMAAGLELPDSVKGIIADCGFTSPEEIWRHVARHNLHLPYGIRRAAANGICKRKIHMAANAYSTVKAMESNRIPVLLIHGADDHFVPVEMTYQNYAACAGPKRLLIVPGADHGMSYLMDGEGYRSTMEEFWNSYC